ncbi:putative plant AUGMIN subunit 7 protein [Helianthus annuus]|uniref:Plant AUGMIN subunit 7 protein n=1 Tax=Helianthus annuus TaxID=4232 RepID=A0A9K3EHT2_HELAN|nr:putative plant AUGMIN subunit 7 protein [Helianthus annuus]KAJ0477440.1 putative plant AUGMIN subunit 7 protein [Helianthus annuus]KAJ0481901.1 putative plant AUGMIN subunit 7 protein [Helianthus annuus]KAJ0498275.1 putative plant AUGMIN subunit 7 protein [Helianthus annuus]KAJ0664278.1 putative plant AUGMIN subunit 7 protein [Helianthus annuus]
MLSYPRDNGPSQIYPICWQGVLFFPRVTVFQLGDKSLCSQQNLQGDGVDRDKEMSRIQLRTKMNTSSGSLMKRWNAFKARPAAPAFLIFYQCGFQPQMTRREVALSHGVKYATQIFLAAMFFHMNQGRLDL